VGAAVTRPRLILDVDGVLADFVGHTLTLLGDMAPPGGREAFTSWEMLSVMSPEARARCAHGWRQPGWCATMPPLPETQNAVDRLGLRAEIVYATAPMPAAPHWMYERAMWLERMFAANPASIVFTHDKSHVWGDVFVDDKAENVDGWAETHPEGFAVLWDAPYNRDWTPRRDNAVRADGWATMFDRLRQSGAPDLPGRT
jgi:5'(3')-deoxyribonucleotidase